LEAQGKPIMRFWRVKIGLPPPITYEVAVVEPVILGIVLAVLASVRRRTRSKRVKPGPQRLD
jgi:hypothetical protein